MQCIKLLTVVSENICLSASWSSFTISTAYGFIRTQLIIGLLGAYTGWLYVYSNLVNRTKHRTQWPKKYVNKQRGQPSRPVTSYSLDWDWWYFIYLTHFSSAFPIQGFDTRLANRPFLVLTFGHSGVERPKVKTKKWSWHQCLCHFLHFGTIEKIELILNGVSKDQCCHSGHCHATPLHELPVWQTL